MALRLLLLPLALAFPTPPEHTPQQISLLERARAKAKAASEAATPQVLSFLDSEGFRGVLRGCCPELAQLKAQELLRRYRAEAEVAELAHALPKETNLSNVFCDVTLKEVGTLPWFPNEWQTALMHNRNLSEGATPVNDLAQKAIFGCEAFAGKVPTWSEVSSRLIYIAHNMRRLDTGSEPFFGDLTVVFNSSWVKDSVLIAPHDTGLYTMVCLYPEIRPKQLNFSWLPKLNCSAWPRGSPVGTLDYLDHLILPNLAAGANVTATGRSMLDAALDLYSRSGMFDNNYQDVPSVSIQAMGEYLESDILANPRLPEAVKFGIGNFATMFGTLDGRELQTTAQRFRWPLFWAFGTGDPDNQDITIHSKGFRFQGNRRIADPANARRLTNASVPAGALRNFEEVWKQAEAVRAVRKATKEDVKQWWASLNQLRVAPVSALSCARPHDCVAVDAAKDCVCLVPPQETSFTV